ncbi:MAG: hypothetical protein WB502_13275 [Thermoactinomyces sp.]
MKKIIAGFASLAIILGSGSLVLAETDANQDKNINFGQMKPHIEQMHPNLSTQERKQMFDVCHGKDGMMPAHNQMMGY